MTDAIVALTGMVLMYGMMYALVCVAPIRIKGDH